VCEAQGEKDNKIFPLFITHNRNADMYQNLINISLIIQV